MDSEAVIEVPEPRSACEVRLDDGTVTVVRQHGNPEGPRLVLSHGNGLAIDLYYPFWSRLADEFELLVYDLRNHGWNAVGPLADHGIPALVRDHDAVLEAIDRRYGTKPATGVFHSISALATLMSPTGLLAARVLFDPPLFMPGRDAAEFDAAAVRAAALTGRRGDRFGSEEEFADLLRYLPGFSRVAPGVRLLMARTTLRRSADGPGYELRCPREHEARIMDQVRSHAPLVDPGAVAGRIRVIGADPALPWAFMPSFDLSRVPAIDYDFLPEASHLLQLERPAECAALLRGFLDSEGLRQVRRAPAGVSAPLSGEPARRRRAMAARDPSAKPRVHGVPGAGVAP